MEKINLAQKFALFSTYWDPKIIGELNGQCLKLVRIQGDFQWHKHDNEDECFLVIQGELKMDFRDQTVVVGEGELIIVPRGIEHRPVADREAQVLLFEPASTINTGDSPSERTVQNPQHI